MCNCISFGFIYFALYLLAPWIYSLIQDCSIFYSFKNWVVVSLSCKNSLYIQDIQVFYQILGMLFSQTVTCLFIFLTTSFEECRFFILVKSILLIFFFYSFCILQFYLRNSYIIQDQVYPYTFFYNFYSFSYYI